MIKKWIKILIIFILMMLLTSCWDYKDVNDKSIVMYFALGKKGENIQLTSEVFQRTNIGTTGGASKIELLNMGAVEGRDLEEIRVKLAEETTLELYMATNRVFIFGRELSEDGLEPYMELIDRTYDQRKTADMVVLEQDPIKLYEINPNKQRSNGFIIEDIIDYLKDNGKLIQDPIYQIRAAGRIEGVGFVLPYIRINSNKFIYVAGEAVFKDYKLVHILGMREIDGLINLSHEPGKLIEMVTEMDKMKERYSFATKQKKRKIKTRYEDNKVYIDIDIDVEAELRYQYYSKPLEEDDLKMLEKRLEDKMKRDMNHVIELSQKDFKLDIFKFYKYFRADNPTIFRQINWADKYPEAKINISVKTTIVNTRMFDTKAKKKY